MPPALPVTLDSVAESVTDPPAEMVVAESVVEIDGVAFVTVTV